MREFFRELVHALEGGEAAELVSVLESSGSTPRGAGAMMAVFPGGRSTGTVGGGNVEYEAQKLCAELLEEKRARVKVLRSTDKWYGVTYREDKPQVVAAIAAMTQSGLYPERLWDI